MRTVEATRTYPTTPDRLWELIGHPSSWGEWLVIHRSWKGEPPSEAAEWLTATATANVMNMPITIEWTFEKVDAPHALVLRGTTRAGVKLALTIISTVTDGDTRVDVLAEVDGGMIDSPMGAVFKNALEGAMRKSLARLGALAH